MNRAITGFSLVLWLGLAWADAPVPLVDAGWIAANSCRDGIVVLDIRSKKIDGESRPDYEKRHIPCAVHTDYVKGGWRTKSRNVPGMLPCVKKLEKLIGGLGVDNDTHVVIAPLGKDSKSVASATRVYWTFKLLGHDKVSILNGGTLGYAKDKSRPLATGAVTHEAKRFRARLRPEMQVARGEVAEAAAQGTTLVDYRRADEHVGITRNAKTKRPGTLRGAHNLPIEWLTTDNSGTVRSLESLRRLMALAEIDPDAPQIAFCNTGHNASLGWFVTSELLGNPQVRVYDGSMAEWSRLSDLPIERKVLVSSN